MVKRRRKRLRAFLVVGASVGAIALPGAAPASAATQVPPPVTTTVALSPTASGWAVVSENDAVLYEATGPDARRRCLEKARELGALRIATHY
jgi:hypothetical protein